MMKSVKGIICLLAFAGYASAGLEVSNAGGGSIGAFSGINRSGESEWSQATINYEIGEGDPLIGTPIGVALYGRADVAFDDVEVSFEVIPEPSTAGLLGLGLLGLLRRRRSNAS